MVEALSKSMQVFIDVAVRGVDLFSLLYGRDFKRHWVRNEEGIGDRKVATKSNFKNYDTVFHFIVWFCATRVIDDKDQYK